MNSRFQIKGINDDTDFCMCCGKQGLKKVVWIEDAETGSLEHFGVICALNPSKAFGIGKSDLSFHEKSFKAIQDAITRKACRLYREAGGEMKMVTHYSSAAANIELWNQCRESARQSFSQN